DIGRPTRRCNISVLFNIVGLSIYLIPETVMNHVAVHYGALASLNVNAVVRPAITFIALNDAAPEVAVDHDAVMGIAVANLVVQELGAAGSGVLGPVKVLQLVMVTVVAEGDALRGRAVDVIEIKLFIPDAASLEEDAVAWLETAKAHLDFGNGFPGGGVGAIGGVIAGVRDVISRSGGTASGHNEDRQRQKGDKPLAYGFAAVANVSVPLFFTSIRWLKVSSAIGRACPLTFFSNADYRPSSEIWICSATLEFGSLA